MTQSPYAKAPRGLLRGFVAAFACLLLLVAVQVSAKDISVKEAADLVQNPPQGLVIVDVRTPAEFREGHIAGAVNMDCLGASFDSQILTLPVLPGFPWVTPVRNWPGRGLDRHRRSRWLS